jgi:hypothetical protein
MDAVLLMRAWCGGMIYAGQINKNIVAHHKPIILMHGFSGDGNLIQSEKKPSDINYGCRRRKISECSATNFAF